MDGPSIFVTAGGQNPFDRLVHSVALWHQARRRARIVFQTGSTALPGQIFGTCRTHRTMTNTEFEQALAQADLVVSDAEMGTGLSVIEAGKPLVLMPRRAELGEHGNDRQTETATELTRFQNVRRADTDRTLWNTLDAFIARHGAQTGPSDFLARPQLISAVRDFVFATAA